MNWRNIFPDFDTSLLALIEKEATRKTFQPGEIIMRTGQFIKSTALIVNGRVKIYREGPDGGEFLMYYIGPGQACAVSMICALQARSSEITAVAEEETEILLLPIQLMDQLMKEHKSWYQFVIQTYRNRFDELLAVVDDVAFRNMDERLEFYLKRYQEKTGKQKIELSHQQIAEDLNSSREVISRLLKKMEQRGLVKLNRNMIELTK
jgi:CRP/FNR family transcriptional regulator